ncbi:MAG: glycosyltransferase family 1 protein [Acidimicrobiales bacterium]|jgi:glycosyltransferase involved in cell wall biosynthesis
MKRLRVLVLAEQLRRSAAGGIGTYVLGLLQGLDSLAAAEPADAPEIVLTASRSPGAGNDPLAALGHELRTSRLPGPLLTRAWDHGLIRAPSDVDLVHAVSLATLEPGDAPLVVTVHDLLWRRIPEAYPARGRRWHEAALARALRRADHFVVPADVVADDLARAGAPPGSISVIPMGSDHLPPADTQAAASHLEQLGVHGPFLLCVGTLEPRKNLQRLVEAYGTIRDALPEPWPLVMVGPSGWGEQVMPAEGIIHAGPVSSTELSGMYATARLLAYVPLIEGFGLPPVEAMSVGTPVVASPLPSTAGAAFEVDPNRTESIAAGLLEVATNEGTRAELVRRGTARSGELTWSSIARRHRDVWERVVREGAVRRGG